MNDKIIEAVLEIANARCERHHWPTYKISDIRLILQADRDLSELLNKAKE